jgi:hypothetical protein
LIVVFEVPSATSIDGKYLLAASLFYSPFSPLLLVLRKYPSKTVVKLANGVRTTHRA